MFIKEAITELEEKRLKALQMGGAEKLRKRRDKGWMTARERVQKLVDSGSFHEIGMLAHSDMRGMENRNQVTVLFADTATLMEGKLHLLQMILQCLHRQMRELI